MSAVRDQYTNIVGVDTHARTNTYAILAAATGQVMDTATFPTGNRSQPCWIPVPKETGRPYESFSTPATLWNAKAPRTV